MHEIPTASDSPSNDSLLLIINDLRASRVHGTAGALSET